MALASVWFGMTSALFERLLASASGVEATGRTSVAAEVAGSMGRAALFDLFLCVALLGIASARLPFGGRWVPALGLLWLTALVGSSLGLLTARLTSHIVSALAGVLVLVVLMASIGGPNRPLPRLNAAARATTAALPTRWTFESLLLTWAGDRADDPEVDPVEPFFPAATDRSGLLACASALLAMLGGAVYLDAVIALSRRRPGWPRRA
jgi:hypothetical protein